MRSATMKRRREEHHDKEQGYKEEDERSITRRGVGGRLAEVRAAGRRTKMTWFCEERGEG